MRQTSPVALCVTQFYTLAGLAFAALGYHYHCAGWWTASIAACVLAATVVAFEARRQRTAHPTNNTLAESS